MFAYLLIAFEIAILYTVFWYIFIREPKPFRVVGDPWGRYEDANQSSSNETGKSGPPEWMTGEPSPYNSRWGSYAFPEVERKDAAKQLPRINRNPALKYGWVNDDEDEPTAAPRILLGFRETIEDLRLRMI